MVRRGGCVIMNLTEMEKCTTYHRDDNGVIRKIECILGLWSVEGRFDLQLINEAGHYFKQYRDDGEYSDILGGKSAAEVMIDKISKECIPRSKLQDILKSNPETGFPDSRKTIIKNLKELLKKEKR